MFLRRWRLNGERGATTVEYGVMIGVIGLIIIVGGGTFSDGMNETFFKLGDCVSDPRTNGTNC